MDCKTINVYIFETKVIFDLDIYHCKETAPMYAAIIPGSDHYFCFTEELENLPRELASVSGDNKVVPTNLPKPEYFRKITFGKTEQSLNVQHTPLSPSKLERFVSAAISEIEFWKRRYNGQINKEYLESIRKGEEIK